MEVNPAYQHNYLIESASERKLTDIFIGLKQRQFNVKGTNEVSDTGLDSTLINKLSALGKEDLISVEVVLQQLMKSIYREGVMATENIPEMVEVTLHVATRGSICSACSIDATQYFGTEYDLRRSGYERKSRTVQTKL